MHKIRQTGEVTTASTASQCSEMWFLGKILGYTEHSSYFYQINVAAVISQLQGSLVFY